MYNNRLSAYKEPLCSITILSMPFMDCRDLSIIESGSIANAKRGLEGHPCLVPLSIGKNCERTFCYNRDFRGRIKQLNPIYIFWAKAKPFQY